MRAATTKATAVLRRVVRTRRALAITLLAGAAAPAAGLAALPDAKSSFEAHDHRTKGENWHVQLEVGKSRERVDTLVLYSEQCKATVLAEKVAISPAGELTTSGTTKGGTWEIASRFTSRREVAGTFRVVKGECDTGALEFSAKRGGDDHENHGHKGGKDKGGGHEHGGPKFPSLKKASAAERAQAERLRRAAHRQAAKRFRSYGATRALGFERYARKWKRPLVFHLRASRYETDNRIFSATRPESLVYWWPRRGRPILLGFMYRVHPTIRPAFGGPIPIYHRHPGTDGKLGNNQMTHVWLTRTLRSAWANCLPVKQLERANPRFRYTKPRTGVSGPEAEPCNQPATPSSHP